MSTLDISEITIKRTIKVYIGITIFCLIFSIIYLSLSFGVISYFMKYLSLIPLLLGVLIYFIISKLNIKKSRISFNLYNAAVYTLTVGSMTQGILEICGGHSFYTKAYLILGIFLILLSIIDLIKINKSR